MTGRRPNRAVSGTVGAVTTLGAALLAAELCGVEPKACLLQAARPQSQSPVTPSSP